MTALGVVVIIVKEFRSPPSGLFQCSHSPANTMGVSPFMWMKWGVFFLVPGSFFHS